jgi:molybdopterin-guanine dinucleotide biosynthesis protein
MLRVQVSGYAASGKTTELLRLAADYTAQGKSVVLINSDLGIGTINDRVTKLGGDPDKLVVVRDDVESALQRLTAIDFVLSEQNFNRKAT